MLKMYEIDISDLVDDALAVMGLQRDQVTLTIHNDVIIVEEKDVK